MVRPVASGLLLDVDGKARNLENQGIAVLKNTVKAPFGGNENV